MTSSFIECGKKHYLKAVIYTAKPLTRGLTAQKPNLVHNRACSIIFRVVNADWISLTCRREVTR
ncbi:MAG: hypothetical protein HGA57_11245 [Chlorobium limicola]|uniref:hypothetical protein n=1 Tax=Chlorobium limicola TaxID=1092 RepID=UPI0023F56B27|nr:hypothetical protein [Chlorobium limicola]NTU50339.1 hypothetical protein [Desulfobulbaceae bacterium]NTV21929.1 hypothetical protein [Chlorobium limicola]